VKRYVGSGIVLLVVAGIFVMFALITFGLAHGDLLADVEFAVGRRRTQSGSTLVSYPAYASISAALTYAAAIALSGIAHISGSKTLLVLSTIVGVLAAVSSIVIVFLIPAGVGPRTITVTFGAIAVALALYVTTTMLRDDRPDAAPTPPRPMRG